MNALAAIESSTFPLAVADRGALLTAVETALHAVPRRNPNPIGANVRFKGDGETMFVMCANPDMEIVATVAAAADSTLDLTVTAKSIRDLLKKAPKSELAEIVQPPVVTRERVENGENVDFLDFDGMVDIDLGDIRYNLTGIHPEGWANFKGPDPDRAVKYAIPGSSLSAAFDSVSLAISNEETRYYLNGVFMAIRNSNLNVVATDGHRLCRQVLDTPEGGKAMPEVIVPKEAIYTLQKLWKKAAPETVTVEVTETRIRFLFDNVVLTSKLIEGNYPDFEAVIPAYNDKILTVPMADLRKAVDGVSVIASARGGKAVKLDIEPGAMTLSVNNPDNGRASSTINGVENGDWHLEIGFNARYLTEFLDNLKGHSDTITFEFHDSGSPTIVKGGREDWTGVLMPMRV